MKRDVKAPKTALLALALLLALPLMAAAQGGQPMAGPWFGPTYAGPKAADVNQDGVYDWVQNQTQWQAATGGRLGGWLDANGDGVHDLAQNQALWHTVTGGGYGAWLDSDGDGICDNFETRPLDGSGAGYKGGK